MKTIITIVLASFFLATSCRKEEIPSERSENGIVVSKAYNWKTSIQNGTSYISNGRTKVVITYNGNILIPTTGGTNNRYLSLLNPADGSFLWHWDDRYNVDTETANIYLCYLKNNFLTYQQGKRSYCINMDTGETAWKFQRNDYFLNTLLYGNENTYYVSGEASSIFADKHESILYKGDLTTGNLDEYIIPAFTQNVIAAGDRIGDVTAAIPYNSGGVNYLVITWQEPMSTYDWQTFLALYNVDTDTWVYEKKVMNAPNYNGVVLAPPVIYNDRIYTDIGKELYCHDIATGEQVWTRAFAQDFMFSGFIIAEDKIIANCEDGHTYGIDPADGSILWQTRSSGTSGRMSYLNGVVYFVGGASGALHAIDVASGRMLWKIENENIGDSASFKTNAVYVFPASGSIPARVIALTHNNAYSFDAVR